MFAYGRALWVGLIGVSILAHSTGLKAENESDIKNVCEHRLSTAGASGGGVSWVGKIVILDTNVILNDPNAIYKYPGAEVIIPGAVHEEVDGKKTDIKVGRAARIFFRGLDQIMKSGGSLKSGARLSNGATLRIDSNNYTWILSNTSYDVTKPDNQIIATALYYTYEMADRDRVVLVSDDVAVRVKAAGEDLQSTGFDYDFMPAKTEVQVENYKRHKVSTAELETFLAAGHLPKPSDLNIAPNQFVMLESEGRPGELGTMARYFYDRENPGRSGLRKLADFSHLPFQPKNIEQALLLDILMDPTIDLVISQSQAGTGKTFLALLAGMLQVNAPDGNYQELMVTRTLVQIGRENLGAFPGSKEAKLKEWSDNYFDTIKALNRNAAERAEAAESSAPRTLSRAERREERRRREDEARKSKTSRVSAKVNLVAFPHLRGRSINDAFLVLDEAQNTSVHEIKTFLTRAGERSKMVVLGDSSQIDLPFLNERNNGLSVTVSLFTGEGLSDEERSRVGYVQLTEGVRSALAELARKLFEQPLPSN